MVELRLLDVYETAYLAGGPDRVVDTAVVALVETGRVRVQRTGEMSVVDERPGHQMEAVVLAAIGSGGWRELDMVRWRAARDERLAGMGDRLQRDGLVAGNGMSRALGRVRRPLSLTSAGRRALRQLRTEPPVRGVAPGTSAAQVALGGGGKMADRQLRVALFRPARPGRFRRHWQPGSAGPAGAACGAHGPVGGHGCGGGGCGGN